MLKSGSKLRIAVTVGVVAVLAGCGSSSSTTSGGSGSTSSAASGGSAASTSTGAGQLVIYSNSGQAFFQPVLNAFEKAYPSIKISYSDVEDPVSFAKYRAEHAQNARTADVIIASSPSLWDQNRDVALNWTPADPSAFPTFRQQFPGVFILSPDPAVSIYSKVKVPANRVPNTFPQLESYLKQYPSLFDKKLVTYTANNFFGYSAFWGFSPNRTQSCWASRYSSSTGGARPAPPPRSRCYSWQSRSAY